MRIVLTHPFCWPYVRRGSERNLDNVARYLVSRGHEVITVSSHPKHGGIETGASGKRILNRPFRLPAMERVHIEETHTFFFPALHRLRSLDPDVVHSFFVSDALAAAYARQKRSYRTIFQMNGIALPGISCRRFPPEAWIWRQALSRADERIVCSRFIGELLHQHYGNTYRVICPPLEISDFPLGAGPTDGRPTILAAADFTVPRKGIRILVDAFQLLKEKVPEATLQISGRVPQTFESEVLARVPAKVRTDIQILGLGQPGELAGLYQRASVMALPSMWEPSGGAMLEAWASGAPVVATKHGGLPEFMTDEVGVLFDPLSNGMEANNAVGLAEALVQGLALARTQGIRERCRRHAERFSAEQIGPLLEELYAGG